MQYITRCLTENCNNLRQKYYIYILSCNPVLFVMTIKYRNERPEQRRNEQRSNDKKNCVLKLYTLPTLMTFAVANDTPWNDFICRDGSQYYYSVRCLTTGPKPLPKQFLHIVRSKASSFKWEYPLLSLRWIAVIEHKMKGLFNVAARHEKGLCSLSRKFWHLAFLSSSTPKPINDPYRDRGGWGGGVTLPWVTRVPPPPQPWGNTGCF